MKNNRNTNKIRKNDAVSEMIMVIRVIEIRILAVTLAILRIAIVTINTMEMYLQ